MPLKSSVSVAIGDVLKVMRLFLALADFQLYFQVHYWSHYDNTLIQVLLDCYYFLLLGSSAEAISRRFKLILICATQLYAPHSQRFFLHYMVGQVGW